VKRSEPRQNARLASEAVKRNKGKGIAQGASLIFRSLLKAWEANSGILAKLAQHLVEGDHTTSRYIYIINPDELPDKHAWEGVNAYPFQFHRVRVAIGKKHLLCQEMATPSQ